MQEAKGTVGFISRKHNKSIASKSENIVDKKCLVRFVVLSCRFTPVGRYSFGKKNIVKNNFEKLISLSVIKVDWQTSQFAYDLFLPSVCIGT